MIIQCPRCSTRWRVPSRAPVENPSFKCGRCHHLFRQFPGAPAAGETKTPAERTRGAAPAADNMEFIFPKRVPALPEDTPGEQPLLMTDDAASAESPPAAVSSRPVRRAAPGARVSRESGTEDPAPDAVPVPLLGGIVPRVERASADATGLEPAAEGEQMAVPHVVLAKTEVVDATAANGEAASAEEANHHVAPDRDQDAEVAHPQPSHAELSARAPDEPETFADDDEWEIPIAPEADTGHVVRPEPPVSPPSALWVFGRSIATVVGILATLTVTIRVAPDEARDWLARVPLIGPSLARDRVLASNVLLQNVNGGYQRLRSGRRVFVIAGDAFNNSTAAIERIEVEGALYGVTGEVDQKVVSAGNRTTVTDLSEAEIAFLQGLDPRTMLAPGESTPFLIVFLEPPRDLREFSSRVLSARPTRRAATPPPAERVQHRASVG